MDFWDDSLNVSEDDEEAAAKERKAAAEKNKQKEALIANKRSQARQREEELRFPKKYKGTELSLLECLEQERVTLADDLKMKYRSGCENAAKFFEGEDGELVGDLRQIKTAKDLKKMIRNRYERIWSENLNKEHDELHKWLAEFHQQTVRALERSCKLCSEDRLYSSTAQNIFVDIRAGIESLASRKKLQEWREQESIKEAEELQAMVNTAENMLGELNLLGEGTSRAARELTRMSINQTRFPYRDSSPDRQSVSLEADLELTEFFKDFYVQDKTPKPEPEPLQKKTADDGIGNFEIPDDDDEEEDEDVCIQTLPTKTVWPGSKWNYIEKKMDSEEEEEDDGVVVPEQRWREELEYEERVPSYFGRHASLENRQLAEKARFEDKRKRNRNKLDFVAYDSPLNKMRIFIQPNDHFFANGDDGPTTDYTDMTLRDGTLYAHSLPWPFILRYDIHNTLTRRKEAHGVLSKQLLLTTSLFSPHLTSLQHRGNFLGRFWYPRVPNLHWKSNQNAHQQDRLKDGLVLQYTMNELVSVYFSLSGKAHDAMGRRPKFFIDEDAPEHDDEEGRTMRGKKKALVAGVLVLTDWRLVFLMDKKRTLTNAVLHYLPTNMGRIFFDTMAECLIELILDANIEFHTIVFAFGGSPSFKKEDFLRFWKKLIVHTTKTYDVFWTAQDWCDGLKANQEQMDYLADFNSYVEKVFEAMNEAGHGNYKFCDVRKRYKVAPITRERTTGERDLRQLQNIYFAYFQYFVNECNCYGNSKFFRSEPEIDDYAANDSRCPLREMKFSEKKTN